MSLPSRDLENRFHRILEIATSISISFSIKVRWKCVGYHSCVQVHLYPILNFQMKMFVHNLHAIFNTIPIIIPPVKTLAIVPFVETPFLGNP